MEIAHKFEFVEGDFNTSSGKLIAVEHSKYGEVKLCFKANMNIPFAKIKLHSKDLATHADEVMPEAYKLATEIARRFNEFPEDQKL